MELILVPKKFADGFCKKVLTPSLKFRLNMTTADHGLDGRVRYCTYMDNGMDGFWIIGGRTRPHVFSSPEPHNWRAPFRLVSTVDTDNIATVAQDSKLF